MSRKKDNSAEKTNPIHVLIVDDDVNLRRSLADAIELIGYIPLQAESGAQAFELARQTTIAVALLDLRLADMSGLEVMREIKHQSADCECILITGYSSQDAAIEALNLDVFAYFRKPYDMQQLLLSVQRAVQKREAVIQLRESDRRFRLVMENAGVIIATLDRDLRYTWIHNPAPQFDPAAVIGRRDDELTDAENARGIMEIKRRVIESGQRVHGEFSISLADGIHYYDLLAVPLFDSQGQVNGMTTVGVDITARKEAEQELADVSDLQRVLMELATRFVNAPVEQSQQAIDEAIETVGQYTHVDRTYVFMLDEEKDSASNTHEWCAPGVESMMEHLQNIPNATAPEFLETHRQGRPFLVPRVSDLPQGDSLRELLASQGIQTLASMPLMDGKHCIGFVGFDSVLEERVWTEPELDLLQVLATILSNLLLRQTREQALQDSEQQFEAVVENISDALYVHDRQGKIDFVNQAACEMTGYSHQELVGMHVFRLDPDSQARDDPTKIWLAIKPGEVIDFEVRHQRKDGSLFPAEVRNTLLTLQGESLVLASVRDISARQQAQQALQEREQKLSTILDVAPVGIGVVVERVFVDVNSRLCEMLGYTPEELIGQSARMLYPSDEDFNYVGQEKYRQIAEQGFGEVETRFQHKNGTILEVLLRSSPIDRDDLLKGVIFTALDMTKRRLAERTLWENEQKLATIFSAAPMGVAVLVDRVFTEVNQRYCEMLGYTREELIGQSIRMLYPSEQAFMTVGEKIYAMMEAQGLGEMEYQMVRKDGQLVDILARVRLIDAQDASRGVIFTALDISERKQAEEALRDSEQRFRWLYEFAPIAYHILAPDCSLLDVNQRWCEILGYSRDEVLGRPIYEFLAEAERKSAKASFLEKKKKKSGDFVEGSERRYLTRDGRERVMRATDHLVRNDDGSLNRVQTTLEDLTEILETEKTLREQSLALEESEQRFRWLYQYAPVAYQILDFDGRITDINQRWSDLLGFDREVVIGGDLFSFMAPDEQDAARASFDRKKASGKAFFEDSIRTYITKDGQRRILRANDYYSRDPEGHFISALITLTDITELKQAQQDVLLQSTALKSAANAVIITDHEGIVQWVNPAFTRLSHYDLSESVGKNPRELINSGLNPVEIYQDLWDTILSGREWQGQLVNRRKDGTLYREEQTVTPLINEKGEITHFIGVKQDITEREQHRRELSVVANISAQLRTAETRSQMLPVLLDQLLEQFNIEAAMLEMVDPLTGDFVIERGAGYWAVLTGERIPADTSISGRVYANKQPYLNNNAKLDGDLFRPDLFQDCNAAAGVPLMVHDEIIGLLWVGSVRLLDERDLRLLTAVADMAANAIHRATLHEQTETRLQHLAALRTIEQTINSSLDLRVTFNVILSQASALLDADALIIRLYNPRSLMLEAAASSGLRTDQSQLPAQRIGEGLAGRAALERRMFSWKSPEALQDIHARFFEREGVHNYHAIPLIVKSDIKGVLEVIQRVERHDGKDWYDNLQTLATQTAIAVDNNAMFKDLQRASVNLTMAIDETLESMAQALNIRADGLGTDNQRLLNLTIRLARAAGISDAECVHVSRGALLHDIGKISIPETVLNKPGPLNEEEWALVRTHPQVAYDLLSQIRYLRPALDIPYCHHERWDGSGYPRGLKGEEIPLAARVFAIVDVYDALLSRRPYRAAWSHEKVLAHIRQNAGVHFDARLVEMFMKIVKESR